MIANPRLIQRHLFYLSARYAFGSILEMLFNSHLSLKRLIFFLAIQNVAGVWGSPYIHSQELEPGKIKAPLSLRSHSPRVATPPFSSCDDWLHTKFIARMPTTSGHGQTPMHNTQPGIAVVNGSVDVRWSSELKVHQWILETEVGPALWDQEDEVLWEVTWKAQNNGAKTIIDLPRERGSCIRIIGIDREGKSLGRTNPVKLDEVWLLGLVIAFKR